MIGRIVAVILIAIAVIHVGAIWMWWADDVLPNWPQLVFQSYCVLVCLGRSAADLWRKTP